MTKFIWMDGKFVEWENAKVHVLTHALHYGSAAFEGIRAYKTANGRSAIFRLDDHLDRLFFSAETLGIRIKFSRKKIIGAITRLLTMNRLDSAYIRPLAFFGYGGIGVYPKNVESNILIIALPNYDAQSKPLRIATSSFFRPIGKTAQFGAKISGNYIGSILAMREARGRGYDEALMLDTEGFVSEGPIQNIFMAKGKSITSPSSRSALHGITKDTVIKLSADIGMQSGEKNISLKELKNADEVFFCGTGVGIVPVISVDGTKIGDGKPGPATKKIIQKYSDVVAGKDKKHIKWLTFVK